MQPNILPGLFNVFSFSRLMENLKSAVRGKTVIFITHRRKITEYCVETIELRQVSSS